MTLSLILFSFGPAFAAEKVYEVVDIPAKNITVGEKLVYKISYLGVPVGESVSEVTEITEVSGRKAYHIVVKVKSYPAIDVLYKVRDEHHSYIDVEKKISLRYDKQLNEGPKHLQEKLEYDFSRHTMKYSNGKTPFKETYVPPGGVQDALSCGFWYRTEPVKPDTSIRIPVFAEGKLWKMEVKMLNEEPVKIKGIGQFKALKVKPVMPFQGIFVKRGEITGWISLDEKRIPLKMQVQVPVLGKITAELKEYKSGDSR